MNRINSSLVFLFLLFSACTGSKPAGNPYDLSSVSWLLGKWSRLNAEPDQTAWETWEKVSDTEWKGAGVSMKNDVKSFEEQLQFLQKTDGLYYAALVPENGRWVYFKMTEMSKNHFVCENPEHDFPKKIAYTLKPGEKLEAVVSGDGKALTFEFEKAK